MYYNKTIFDFKAPINCISSTLNSSLMKNLTNENL
jgi:hypothetical protein